MRPLRLVGPSTEALGALAFEDSLSSVSSSSDFFFLGVTFLTITGFLAGGGVGGVGAFFAGSGAFLTGVAFFVEDP